MLTLGEMIAFLQNWSVFNGVTIAIDSIPMVNGVEVPTLDDIRRDHFAVNSVSV